MVVNLAGESIADGRWTEARAKRLRDSRVVGTRALVDELRGLAKPAPRPDLGLRRSATTATAATRSSPRPRAGARASSPSWRATGRRRRCKAAEIGMRVVVLRNGAVLAREGGFLRKILPPFRLGARRPRSAAARSGCPGSTSTTRSPSSATRWRRRGVRARSTWSRPSRSPTREFVARAGRGAGRARRC